MTRRNSADEAPVLAHPWQGREVGASVADLSEDQLARLRRAGYVTTAAAVQQATAPRE